MNRRQIIRLAVIGLSGLALPSLAQEQKARARRIGFLGVSSAQNQAQGLAAFRAGMAELRWVEGRDYVVDARYANGVGGAVRSLAAELVSTQPDLLLAPADGTIRDLAQRTKSIPIVFSYATDPVGSGFATSLRNPGGNLTGLTSLARGLGAKRLQLLKEAFPRVERAVLLLDNGPAAISQIDEIEKAASRLGMNLSQVELRQEADIEQALKRGAALGAQAYVAASAGMINNSRKAIADGILRSRVPAIFSFSEVVEVGGLMSYGPSREDNFRRAAAYVDKIFNGSKPGDLPIEQPTKFELVINMKAAKAIGFTIPKSVLLQADRVIE